MATNGTAIEVLREKVFTHKADLEKLLPRGYDAERFIRSALIAFSKSPQILACTPGTITRCLLESAGYGLAPTGLLGGAWILPFRDSKSGTTHAQLILSYVGLCKLVRRSNEIATIEARVVREGDVFDVEYGHNQTLRHIPRSDNGEITHVYSLVRFKNGAWTAEIMTRDQVEGIRARSKARDSGPWKTDFEEMARKTVLRRHCKYLPLEDVAVQAIESDDEVSGFGFEVRDRSSRRGEEIAQRSAALAELIVEDGGEQDEQETT